MKLSSDAFAFVESILECRRECCICLIICADGLNVVSFRETDVMCCKGDAPPDRVGLGAEAACCEMDCSVLLLTILLREVSSARGRIDPIVEERLRVPSPSPANA